MSDSEGSANRILDSADRILKSIEALGAEIAQLRLDLTARCDQLEATMQRNHEAIMRQVWRHGR
jgi:hypothetical protein